MSCDTGREPRQCPLHPCFCSADPANLSSGGRWGPWPVCCGDVVTLGPCARHGGGPPSRRRAGVRSPMGGGYVCHPQVLVPARPQAWRSLVLLVVPQAVLLEGLAGTPNCGVKRMRSHSPWTPKWLFRGPFPLCLMAGRWTEGGLIPLSQNSSLSPCFSWRLCGSLRKEPRAPGSGRCCSRCPGGWGRHWRHHLGLLTWK